MKQIEQTTIRSDVSATDFYAFLQQMITIRTFEERLLQLFSRGELMGTTHTCIGQEANAVGVASVVKPDDIVVSNHRGHGHFLAHIGDMDGLMAEVMGRATGVCGGWGGSQHLYAREAFYSNGIQGGIAPLATGIALAEKLKGNDRIAVVYLGDGTMGQGAVYESFNMASLWDIPILFVIEDNQIAQTTPSHLALAGTIVDRPRAFGIHTTELVYPPFGRIREEALAAVDYIRTKSRPCCLVIRTYRYSPHSKGDDTRSVEEIAANRKLDPVLQLQGEFPPAEVEQLERQAKERVESAYQRAVSASVAHLQDRQEELQVNFTAPTTETLRPFEQRSCEMLRMVVSGGTMLGQLNSALDELFAEYPEVYMIGEDLLDPYGGAFKVATGLSSRYPDRVIPSPISEGATVGLAGGMALRGLRPIVEIMFGDFLTLCMDQLVNHIAKYRGMYDNQVSVPLVVRTPMGGRRGYGPTHSQTLDKHFLGVHGLEVISPSPLHPAGAMLRAAVLKDDPVLFLENKVCYNYSVSSSAEGIVDDFFVYYAGSSDVPVVCLSLTEFQDESITLFCYGGMLPIAMDAARKLLLEHEISVRILDFGCLYPLQIELLGRLVVPDSAVVVIEEGSTPYGVGAELCAALGDYCPGRISSMSRIGSLEFSIAAARSLEDQVLPQVDDVVQRVQALVND